MVQDIVYCASNVALLDHINISLPDKMASTLVHIVTSQSLVGMVSNDSVDLHWI